MAGTFEDAGIDEQELADAALRGCVQAFEVLVARYYAPLVGHLARQTGDRDLAAEIAQETFLDAYSHLERLQEGQPFAAWLYRIARNHMLSEMRRRRLRRVLSLEWVAAGRAADSIRLHEDDQTATVHESDLIQQVLDTLNPTLREALLLSSLWGYPSHEVGAILDISPEAARQRVGRAKEQFRQRYAAFSEVRDGTSM
jgi:RNA polymerase sigma-70 factor (ECF subfamily)